ncbi:MAG TPA: hypothetical protein VFF67_00860 [Thermoplasmata archaeon]|nr:hypothetical protein [Thermoplasmata archaeon]
MAYQAHLQKFLTFVVIGATGLVAEIQQVVLAVPLPWNITGSPRIVLISGAFIAAVATTWGLLVSFSELYLISRLEIELGMEADEDHRMQLASGLPRAGWMLRRSTTSHSGLVEQPLTRLAGIVLLVFVWTVFIAGVLL